MTRGGRLKNEVGWRSGRTVYSPLTYMTQKSNTIVFLVTLHSPLKCLTLNCVRSSTRLCIHVVGNDLIMPFYSITLIILPLMCYTSIQSFLWLSRAILCVLLSECLLVRVNMSLVKPYSTNLIYEMKLNWLRTKCASKCVNFVCKKVNLKRYIVQMLRLCYCIYIHKMWL